MTNVTVVKSPLSEQLFKVGEYWRDANGVVCCIKKITLNPLTRDGSPKCLITIMDAYGDNYEVSLDNFIRTAVTLETEPTELVGGLKEEHLLDSDKTIAVGQRWQHYKGAIYRITEVALDANEGVYDFNKARISYRGIESGKDFTWSLTVEEFLKTTDKGPRFTLLPRDKKIKREIMLDRSLKYYWRIAE